MKIAYSVLIAILILYTILPVYGLAEEFFAGVPQKDISVNISTTLKTNITIKNAQLTPHNILITLNGKYPSHIFVDKSVFIPANSTVFLPLTFYPIEDIGRFNVSIYGESVNSPSINFTIPINLWVQTPEKYQVNGFSKSVDGGNVLVSLTVKPHDKLKTDINFEILNINGEVVKTSSVSKDIDKEETISQTLDISDLSTGQYKIRASIKNTGIVKQESFDIGVSRNIKQEKQIIPGLFSDEVKITLQNYGNLVENDYKFYENVGKNKLVTLVTNVTDIINQGDANRYEFTIGKLRPGEVATVIYKLENWMNFVTTIMIVIVIVGAGTTAFIVARKPTIKKKFVKRARGQYSVMIEIKNSRLQDLKDVSVRDIVQPLVKVKESETTSLAPHIRESQVGTELVWRIGSLKKGESRVIHYMMDSLINAESIRLSPATMNYVISGNRRGLVKSNGIILS